MDTTIQNRLNIERDKVLYNTVVTHASINMNWLVTAELLDDQQHTIESRIKFWIFDQEKQNYSLNTQIELPHEEGVKAIEFSTQYSVENLLCASSGKHDIKVWALEDSDSIYSKFLFINGKNGWWIMSGPVVLTNDSHLYFRKRQDLGLHRFDQLQGFAHIVTVLFHRHIPPGGWLW